MAFFSSVQAAFIQELIFRGSYSTIPKVLLLNMLNLNYLLAQDKIAKLTACNLESDLFGSANF